MMKRSYGDFFSFIMRGAIFALVLAPLMFAAHGARVDDSCDEYSQNDFINQRLALCSTHVYNIGATANPADPATRQTMNDVVALKSTIMTQQMKKQYDFLETTVKRFKVQLEKAILVSKMQASGAADQSGSSSSGSASAQLMNGARDCNQGFNTRDKLQCLQSNSGVIYNATSGGTKSPATDVRRQISTDINILTGLVIFLGDKSIYAFEEPKVDISKCTAGMASAECVKTLQNGVAKMIAAQEQAERSSGARQ